MDPGISRRMLRTLEPYHGMIYFVPEARDRVRSDRPHGPADGLLRLACRGDGRSARGRRDRDILQLQSRARSAQHSAGVGAGDTGGHRSGPGSRRWMPRCAACSGRWSTAPRCRRRPRSRAMRQPVAIPKVGRCTPGTHRCRGPTRRISCCGTRRRCCASSGVTGTSRRWSPRASPVPRRW